MKKLLSLLLAALMIFTCLAAVSCNKGEQPENPDEGGESTPATVSRSFLAGYESEDAMSGRVLMNLMSDGTLELYVGTIAAGEHQTAKYTGTYTLGENEEFDETISFTYTHGETTEKVENATILDGNFAAPFYMISAMTSSDVKFYETSPAKTEGDTYVGYLTKVGGMGNMVYAYALNLKDDGTFSVSIMYMAAVMHVWGESAGTYTVEGDKITFTYDVQDGEGGIAAEDFVSEGTKSGANELSVGFNIVLTSPRASDAAFVKVN